MASKSKWNRQAGFSPGPRIEELEPRLLLSADPVGALLPATFDVDQTAANFLLDDNLDPVLHEPAAAQTEDERLELVFVDSDTPDYEQLVEDLFAQRNDGRLLEIIVLDNASDGVGQITTALQAFQGVDALHIISHGSDGSLDLGSTRLDAGNLDKYEQQLQGWGNHLDAAADILIYGCNLAATEVGQSLVSQIAGLTGADIAASDDLTGSAALGADWVLEQRTGAIESDLALSASARAGYDNTLAAFIVDTFADTSDVNPGNGVAEDSFGNTSLRAAIEESNVLPGADTITLGAGNFILTGTELTISSDITIIGSGVGLTVIDAQSLSRVFAVTNGNVSISGVTLQNGDAGAGDGGGVHIANNAIVTLQDVLLTGHEAGSTGGAIWNDGTVTLDEVTLDLNNASDGGALYNRGLATVTDSTISNNTTTSNAGGIWTSGAGNQLILTNVTISGNSTAGNGGGLYNARDADLVNVTITNNTAITGAGIHHANGGGTTNISNSIVAGNIDTDDVDNPDITGSYSSGGYNLIGNAGSASGFTDGVNGDHVGSSGSPIDPMLAVLADNGGATLTHALLAGSTGINAGTSSGAPTTDQRGIARDDGSIDIGAYEYAPTNIGPTITSTAGTAATEGELYTYTATVDDPDDANNGTDLTWTLSGAPAGMVVSSTGVVTWTPAVGVTTSGPVTLRVSDGNEDGAVDDTEVFTVSVATPSDSVSLWLSTEDDVAAPSGANGLNSWEGGSVLSLNNPALAYEPSGTNGTLGNVFNLDDFVQDGDARVDSLHYVGSNIQVGTNDIPLLAGDILLSSVFPETLVNSDLSTLAITSRDVVIFRPDSHADYSLGGTFTKLINGADLGIEIEGITLVETTTTVGSGGGATTLNPGDFLFTDRDNPGVIYRLQPGVLGGAATNTALVPIASSVLVDGTDIGIDQTIHGIELVESDVTIGDRTLTAGQILLSLYADDTVAGTDVSRSDIFILNVTTTGTSTAATAEAFFTGADIGFDTFQESPWAVALRPGNVTAYDLQVTSTTAGGTSINSDGGNDTYYVADNGSALLGGLSTVTLEATFSMSSPAADNAPLVSYAVGGNDEELGLFIKNDGRIWFLAHSPGSPNQSTAAAYPELFDGEVHHVAVSWDSATGAVVFYIDGDEKESFTGYQTGQLIAGGGELVIGQDQDSVLAGFNLIDVFSGTLYDMRIFNDVRTSAEIANHFDQALAASEPGMIANWRFSNSASGTVTDSVSGNNLTEQHVADIAFSANAPELILSVSENAADGEVLGSIAAFDPDASETFLYSLTDTAGGRFAINSSNGQVILANASLLNYEASTSHDITVDVHDSGSLAYSEVFTVSVLNVSNPRITSNGGGDTAAINRSEGSTAVTTVQAEAADPGVLVYGIHPSSDDDGFFTIDSSTGVLSFMTGPDYEVAADLNGDNVYEVTVTVEDGNGRVDSQDISVTVTDKAATLWITGDQDIPAPGADGLPSGWSESEVLEFGGTDLTLGDSTDGDFSSVFDFDLFTANASDPGALHYVSNNLTIGSGENSVSLRTGDVLVSFNQDEDILAAFYETGVQTTVHTNDLLLFRPDSVGNYSSGTFYMLLNGVPDPAGAPINGLHAMSLVEQDTIVGSTLLEAGTFIFAVQSGATPNTPNNIFHFAPTAAGTTAAVGTSQILIDGADINLEVGSNIRGLDLIESAITIGGKSFSEGDILVTLSVDDTVVGDGPTTLDTSTSDIFVLKVTVAEPEPGNVTAATAEMVLDGSDVNFSGSERVYAIAVVPENTGALAQDDRVGLSFDGVDDYISVENDASLVMTNNFTMEAWVNLSTSATGGSQIIVNKEGEYELGVTASTGEIKYAIADGVAWGWHDTGTFLTKGEWTHIAVTYSAGTIETYVNGALVDTFVQGGPVGDVYTAENRFSIGGRENASDQRFHGQIDEVRIWNVTRSEGEIKSSKDSPVNDPALDPTLVGYWQLDEGIGDTALDLSSYGNDGTFGGFHGPTAKPDWSGYIADENSLLTVSAGEGVLANDVDPDGNPLTVTNLDDTGMLGVLVMAVDGSFTYDARGAFDYLLQGEFETETFTYTANDGTGDSNIATATITVRGANDAPTITSTAGTTATEGSLYTYTATVSDPDDANNGTDLTWSLSGAPTGMTVSSTGVVTWTPAEGVTTSGSVTLTVSDGNEDGAVDDTETFTITVTPVNQGPTITSTAGTTATEDTLYTYTATVSDPDDANNGTDLTWTLSGAPTGMTVSSTGVVTWTPAEGVTTSGAVTLRVSDGNEDGAVDDTETFTITVTPVNDAPTITSTAGTTATEGNLYTYTATVSDPDDANNGTDLTWSLSGAPTGMTVSSTGVVTWTPAEGVTTSGSVTLTVSDGNEDGAVDDTETFTITVTPVNQGPTITSTAGTSATEGNLYTYTASVSDPDDANNGTDLTWTLSGAPTGMTVSSTGVVTWTPAEGVTSSGPVTLRVSDGNEDGAVDDTETFTITVTPVNQGPTITSTAGTTAIEGSLYTYTASVSDPDDANNGTDLTWSLSGAPTGMTVSSTGVVTWTPAEGVTTSGSVTLTVSDGNEDGAVDDTETFTITVTPVNQGPTITSTAGTTATEGSLYTYTATVSDPDDANNGTDLTWTLSGAPTGMTVSSTGVVTWTPAEGVTTSGSVTLTVSDGNEDGAVDDTETFTITVTPVNDAPTITSTAGTTATEGNLYTYTATVSDPDDANNGTDLTWSLSGAPTGMTVSSTGVVTWTPAEGVTTSGSVTLTVSDGNEDGAVDDTETFTITVTPVNQGPTITSTAGTTATEGNLYTYTATVVDPDDANNGTDLTWTLSGAPTGMTVSSTGVVTWTPAEGVTTSGAVTLTVSDGNEDGAVDDTETFTISVTPVNNGPTITSTAGTTGTEGSLYTYTATVSDPDDANNGTDLTWTLSGAPTGMTVSSTGVVTWTPAEGVTTSGAVTLRVSDGNEDGAVDDTETFTITVTPVNQGPTITSTAGTTATEGSLYTYTATVSDPDDANNGTDLTWTLSGAPTGMTVSSTGVVTWTPAEGVTTSGAVTLRVSDGNEDGAVDDTETFTITVTPVNQGPTITSTAGTTATEDTLYTYTATVSDPDDANNGTDLTWTLSGAPTGMTVSSTGVVTWTPAEGVTTSGAVTLRVSDGNEDGAVDDTETFTITVTPVNQGPTITSTAGTTATEGNLYTYTATVSDPDDANNGTDLTWTLSGAPTGMTVSSTGVVTWTPAEGVTTSGAVTLRVSDGNEDGAVDDTETFTITVTPVNQGPTITSTAGATATEDTLYTYTATVSDPDDANNGTDLTWSLSGAPTGMTVSSTGVVTWTPAEGVTTSGSVTLTVSDGNEDGAVDDTETFTIAVTPVNQGPTITSTAGTSATEGNLYTYTASVSDPDDANNGTDLTWTLSGAPTGMTVSSTGVVTWTPAEGVTSSGPVTLRVSDGNEDGAVDDTETFTITVTPVNQGPTITSTAGTTAIEGSLYTYTASVSDPDDANNGTDLTWSLIGAPTGMTVSSTGVVTWTPAEGVTSSGPVTLRVSDGNEDGAVDDTETFTITVTPVNQGPTITSTAGTTATEDTLYTYTATVSDPDDANNGIDLTWSLSGAPTGMTVSSTGVVTWTPAEGLTSSGPVTLRVSDGNEDGAVDDTETFTITVTPVNDAPTITSTAGTTATEGSLYTYTASVSDPDDANNGTDLTWTLSGAPTGMTVSSTGVVTWTPAEGVTTSGSVTLTVSDGNEDGAVDDTETFTIAVTPVNNGPTITSTAGTTATEDTLYTYTATVVDPDDANNGTDLTWTLSGAPTGMTVSSTGVVTWTPSEGVTTSGVVTLRVSDGNEDGALDDTETFTITVTPVNDGHTGSVYIDNMTPSQGDVLTASNTLADPDGMGDVTYQWYRDGVVVDDVTGDTYVTGQADVGSAITVLASYEDDSGFFEISISDPTANVLNVNDAPLGSVTINNDSPIEGDVLTASHDLVDVDGLGTISYQWQRDGVVQASEASEQYVLTQDDVGTVITVKAMYVDGFGANESVTSSQVGPVQNLNDAPTGAPRIDGIVEAGETLTADTSGIGDADGLGDFAYEWQRSTDGGFTWETVGDGESYTLAEDDSDAEIRLHVFFTDDQSTLESLFSDQVRLPSSTPAEPPPGENSNAETILVEAPIDENRPVDEVIVESSPSERVDELPEAAAPTEESGAATTEEIAQASEREDQRLPGSTRALLPNQEIPRGILELIEAGPKVSEVAVTNVNQEQVGETKAQTQLITKTELQRVAMSSTSKAELRHVDAVLSNETMWQGIEAMKQQMDSSESAQEALVVELVSTTGAGLMAGLVAYALRGGALMASLMSTMPLWQGYDPLPILSANRKDKKDDEKKPDSAKEEKFREIESMFDQA